MSRPELPDECFAKGPQSSLEKHYVEEFLKQRGYRLEDLEGLPADVAEALMRDACKYASLKLAEVESRARFRDKIRHPT